MGDDGEFHAVDEVVNLSDTPIEGWLALLLFWVLGGVVFTQFFTRYVLNDSASWTEEIARYLLVGTVFVGAGIGVAKNNHIQVDLLYRYLPAGAARVLSTLVDVMRIAFFASMTVYTAEMMGKLKGVQMSVVDLPMNIVYGVCLFGLAVDVAALGLGRHCCTGGVATASSNDPPPRCRIAEPRMLKILFLAMLATGLPVAIAMAGSSLAYILFTGDLPGFTVVHRMIGGIDSFPLLAVPFFILAGNLMNNAGITNRIYNFALALVGWLKGGLGHVNILGSVIFAGMSGTAIADAAGLGTIEIKAMKDHGYPTGVLGRRDGRIGDARADHSALVAVRHLRDDGQRLGRRALPRRPAARHPDGDPDDADGRLVRAQEQVGRRHSLRLCGAWGARCSSWPSSRSSRYRCTGCVQAGLNPQAVVGLGLVLLFAGDRYFKWQAVLPIMTPVLLIGGMTTGLFTPTEGAIAASVWATVLGLFWYRTLTWKMFVKVSLDSVETTATIMFVVAAASIFGWMLTATGVTTAIAQWVLGFTQQAWVFLLLANLLMLFVGCFLEPTAAITILVPILLPIATQLGVDPVHFGLVMVLNLMIGLLHPPMGMVLFVLARVAKLSVERTTVAILPWLVPLLLSLVLLTYVPAISLWLPRVLGF